MGVSMAEWAEAFQGWVEEVKADNQTVTGLDAFRAGARWMTKQASNHLGYEVEQFRDDEEQYTTLAHIHTDVIVAMLRDVGDWGTTQTGDE
jgi:hypothetical protein